MRSGKKATIRRLEPSDADSVFELYETVSKRTTYGFVSDRQRAEFAEILAVPGRSASVGAWAGDRLVAYSLSSAETGPVYPSSAFVRSIQQGGEPIWTGKGTIVDPEFEGLMLMPRLLKERHSIMAASGGFHSAGLIAIDNMSSLAGAMRAGAWVVGLENDAYCLNFVCYIGNMRSAAVLDDACTLPVQAVDQLASRFAAGWVATAYRSNGRTGKREFVLNAIVHAGKGKR